MALSPAPRGAVVHIPTTSRLSSVNADDDPHRRRSPFIEANASQSVSTCFHDRLGRESGLLKRVHGNCVDLSLGDQPSVTTEFSYLTVGVDHLDRTSTIRRSEHKVPPNAVADSVIGLEEALNDPTVLQRNVDLHRFGDSERLVPTRIAGSDRARKPHGVRRRHGQHQCPDERHRDQYDNPPKERLGHLIDRSRKHLDHRVARKPGRYERHGPSAPNPRSYKQQNVVDGRWLMVRVPVSFCQLEKDKPRQQGDRGKERRE